MGEMGGWLSEKLVMKFERWWEGSKFTLKSPKIRTRKEGAWWQPERKLIYLSSQQRVTARKEADILILTTEGDSQKGRGRIWLSLFVVIFLSGCHPWTLYQDNHSVQFPFYIVVALCYEDSHFLIMTNLVELSLQIIHQKANEWA